jgi:hypothetical protein
MVKRRHDVAVCSKKKNPMTSSPLQTLQLLSHFKVGAGMIFINCRINPTTNTSLEWRRECPDIILAAATLAMECHSLTNSLVSINGHE